MIGHRVICIDDSPTSTYGARDLKIGATYTVRWSGNMVHPGTRESYFGVLLKEVDRGRDPLLGTMIPFDARRFASLESMPENVDHMSLTC